MELVLTSTTKRRNSTSRPVANEFSQRFNVKFRAACSIRNPEFVIRFDEQATLQNIGSFNYAILDNKFYYWVNDAVYNADGTFTISCALDVLATYRPEILDSTAFILRAENTYNPLIIDTAVPTTANADVRFSEIDSIFAQTFYEGTFIVGIINNDDEAVGVPHYYAFTSAEWNDFNKTLLGGIEWAGIDAGEISKATQKALINPMQYIVSAMWLPCPVIVDSVVTSIPIGYWNITTNSGASRVSGFFSERNFSITLPMHPQQTNAPFTAYAPYSTYILTIEPFGEITLPAWVTGGSIVNGFVRIDPRTGDGILRLSINGTVIDDIHAQVGVEMPIGQISTNVMGIDAKSAVAGLLANADPSMYQTPGGFGDLITGIGNSVLSSVTSAVSAGSLGGIGKYSFKPNLKSVFKRLTTTNYAKTLGKPVCQQMKIGNLTGFVVCSAGSLEYGGGFGTCNDEIAQYLTTGFYVE